MKICLTELYISFSLSFGNILEWWVKRTSALSRAGQCLILPCNSHNSYHSVFAKVVNKCVQWLKTVSAFFSVFFFFPFLQTHIYIPCGKTDFNCLAYLLWKQWKQGRQSSFYITMKFHYKKPKRSMNLDFNPNSQWFFIFDISLDMDLIIFNIFRLKNWCKFFKHPFFLAIILQPN